MMNRKRLATVLAATALSATLAGPAASQSVEDLQKQINALQSQINELKKQQESAKKSDIKVKWEPAPSIQSADGRFEMNLRGRIYADAGWVSDDDDNEDVKATEFRTVRLGIEGKAWKDIKYKAEVDFADNEVDLKDAYLQWKGPASITFGQFKTPNSLEEQTSSRYITFMERASFTDAFDFARQIGIGVGFSGENFTANAGVFRGANGTADEDEGETFAARVTFGDKIGNGGSYHVGAHYRYRNAGDDQSDFRYRQRPHNHLASRFINTDRIADSDSTFGVELAGVMGPFSAQAEYAWLKANLSDDFVGNASLDDPTFTGGYISLSYFVTGESRAYKASKGSFQRIKVNKPVFEGGMGAWEIAARYDVIDLTDESIQGGEQDTWIIGVNWYLNRHTRFMINYSRSDIKDAFLVSDNGPDGENDVDAFGIRFQVDW
ncbi:MAG: hypothetical protein D6763_03610 [Alphaproteobacteria bacterium]|nr:MAG: hypothetical protein D6763_03610 [Alphaproteobacteria bacterium]